MERINIIYGLRDPRNDVYQYIGKSTVGLTRPLRHLLGSHSPRVNAWMSELSSKWLYPIIDIIEKVSDIDELPDREKYWINYYHIINPDLFNIDLIEPDYQNRRSEEDERRFDFLSIVIENIPSILKKERLYRNITQEQLSEESGLARSTISLCENGSNVGFYTIRDYVRILKGVDIVRSSHNGRTVRTVKCGDLPYNQVIGDTDANIGGQTTP